MTAHSSTLAWKIPWTEDPGRLQSMGRKGSDTTELLSLFLSLVAQMVKNPPATRETQLQSLGWEDPLEKGTATHASILAWRILWTEEPGRPQSMGQQSRTRLSDFQYILLLPSTPYSHFQQIRNSKHGLFYSFLYSLYIAKIAHEKDKNVINFSGKNPINT